MMTKKKKKKKKMMMQHKDQEDQRARVVNDLYLQSLRNASVSNPISRSKKSAGCTKQKRHG